MGRYTKNKELRSAGYSIRLPYTSPAIGPECPVEGLVRYNYTTDTVEIYSNNKWRIFRMSDDIEPMPTKDTFYGDADNRVFGPMSFEYDPGEELKIFVYVQNVWQNPNVNYTVEGFYIIMASPPPDGHAVVVIHGIA
jgi:hypothetical protein